MVADMAPHDDTRDSATSGPARTRAPRRAGERRQITVPPGLWASATALAAELGTTPNDALVRLAADGGRRWEADRQRRERAAAVLQALARGLGLEEAGPFLTEAEAHDAAMAMRRGE